jgi:predicted TIM-barrel fold metal-dependent hydrolase
MTAPSLEANPNDLPQLEGIKVVDADTHLSEAHDLWTSRAPARLRNRVPRVKPVDGGLMWIIDEDISLGVVSASSALHKSGRKSVGNEFFQWQNDDVDPGSYDLGFRLKAMDAMGVYAQIVYPNVLGFGGQRSFLVDAELRQLSIEIYNDAMAEMQAASGRRLFPMALLPWWDVRRAVAEAERCAAMGMRGVNINPDPNGHGLPDLSDRYWYPLWEACCSLNLPVNFHIGASDESMSWFGQGAWPSHSENAQLAFGSTMLFVGNQRVLVNMLISRFLEKFPTLKVVSVESGISWIPFVLEAVEYQMSEAGLKMELSPWEVFQRQIYACCWFERRHLLADIRRIGEDSILFETDYPHPTCLYPDPLKQLQGTIEEMTRNEREKLFNRNAVNVYGLPI